MLRKYLYRITSSLPCRLIDIDGRPYLERYAMPAWLRKFLKRFGVTAYLHRFVRGDSERHVHDHPWPWALSFVLCGSYIEERITGFDVDKGWHSVMRRVRWFNYIKALDFHRITEPKPETWTLFIHGPRQKSWGFLHQMESAVGYWQPFDTARAADWDKASPPGAQAGRQPYPCA